MARLPFLIPDVFARPVYKVILFYHFALRLSRNALSRHIYTARGGVRVNCRIIDMRHKEVINIKDGMRIGSVCDVEIDTVNAKVVSIVIYGRLRFFGLFGREDDIVIRWEDIQVIGDDTILVTYDGMFRPRKTQHWLGKLFSG